MNNVLIIQQECEIGVYRCVCKIQTITIFLSAINRMVLYNCRGRRLDDPQTNNYKTLMAKEETNATKRGVEGAAPYERKASRGENL